MRDRLPSDGPSAPTAMEEGEFRKAVEELALDLEDALENLWAEHPGNPNRQTGEGPML